MLLLLFLLEVKTFFFEKKKFINGIDERTGYLPEVLVFGQKLILGKPLNYISLLEWFPL